MPPITPAVAVLARSDEFGHGDPADRIIAAAALAQRAPLVSADARLRKLPSLKVIWQGKPPRFVRGGDRRDGHAPEL